MVGELTDGGSGGGPRERMRSALQRFRSDLLGEVTQLVRDALANYRPRGLSSAVFIFDSGESGTALVARSTAPNGWVRIPYPAEIQRWHAHLLPSGTATVVIKAAPAGTALASATTILTLSLSGTEQSDDTFTPIAVEEGTRLAAFLTAVASAETASVNLEHRRK